jgi:UDP-N-acetylmuramate dehydrogenase
MKNIEKDYNLAGLTTFKIGGAAKAFSPVETAEELWRAISYAKENSMEVLLLGGGSNVLISDQGYNGFIVQLQNKGIEISSENENEVILRIASGEIWDDVVAHANAHGYWGIENLSHIPGLMGGFAVQNVGAYGQEASQVVMNVETVDLQSGEEKIFLNQDCEFGYRKSIFNTNAKGRFAILYTTLKLSKVPKPNLSFYELQKHFDGKEASIEEIRKVVCSIRDKKFPFPTVAVDGNAGSFFKNPTLTGEEYQLLEEKIKNNFDAEVLERLRELKNRYPESKTLKIAAFLIDICGLKGYEKENVRINPVQPLIILNKGKAKATDVLELVQEVRSLVKEKTSVHLYTEPELIGFTREELAGYGFNEKELKRYI